MGVLGPDLTHDGGHVMRRLAILAVVAALMPPTEASGQNYTFGDWARDHGYSPGDVMPRRVCTGCSSYSPCSLAIDSLNGIGEFDWTGTPTTRLNLDFNQTSSIESDDFSGLTNLESLCLYFNDERVGGSGPFAAQMKL
jgi:hypothetical protein